MTVLENLTAEHKHGDIVVAFVPDEEIGLCGAKALDLKRFDVDFASDHRLLRAGGNCLREL